mmetsp:Transcript_7017/g.10733  ORF Transcript_7017/g.10733 Transcript_7017/m.10733 type:complete len:234 (-) Transcript_7017:1476-2177(-)
MNEYDRIGASMESVFFIASRDNTTMRTRVEYPMKVAAVPPFKVTYTSQVMQLASSIDWGPEIHFVCVVLNYCFGFISIIIMLLVLLLLAFLTTSKRLHCLKGFYHGKFGRCQQTTALWLTHFSKRDIGGSMESVFFHWLEKLLVFLLTLIKLARNSNLIYLLLLLLSMENIHILGRGVPHNACGISWFNGDPSIVVQHLLCGKMRRLEFSRIWNDQVRQVFHVQRSNIAINCL